MTYKERLKNRTGINNLQELLKQDPYDIYRTPNVGFKTIRGAVLEMTKEEFGDWYDVLFTAIFDDLIMRSINYHFWYLGDRR